MNAFFSEDLTKTATQTLLRVLVAYNRFYIKTKINYRYARKENAVFNFLCECFETIFTILTELFVSFTCNKLEPSDPTWVSYCQYIPAGNELNAITNDMYTKIPPNDLQNWSNDTEVVLDPTQQYLRVIKTAYLTSNINTNYSVFCSRFSDRIKSTNPYQNENSMTIAKICPSAMIVRLTKNVDTENDLTGLRPSSARFLEVEYKCGNGPPLTIEIPRSHYFAGNEILSKAYVLRYLEHLPIYSRWAFNESEYSLRIVDEDSEVFSLNSNQHILLELNGYRIIDQSNLPSSVEKEETNEPKEPIEN
jgi:hypothetical protein